MPLLSLLLLLLLLLAFSGLEIGLEPRHDTITFVISDEDSGIAPPCCGGGGGGRGGGGGGVGGGGGGHPARSRGAGARLSDSLPVYDLQITVFPVDSQAPSLATGQLKTAVLKLLLPPYPPSNKRFGSAKSRPFSPAQIFLGFREGKYFLGFTLLG